MIQSINQGIEALTDYSVFRAIKGMIAKKRSGCTSNNMENGQRLSIREGSHAGIKILYYFIVEDNIKIACH